MKKATPWLILASATFAHVAMAQPAPPAPRPAPAAAPKPPATAAAPANPPQDPGEPNLPNVDDPMLEPPAPAVRASDRPRSAGSALRGLAE
ncbi:MAG TPA: hypothetical protein VGK73_00490, partial [Polyangiaceae bacterium]